ncbi:hypothetical protein BDB01DRAFT_754269 [Pilobolus umbonatus]|nr:hypothetical protein BDB01DRAFT_754269 [Pilobolus umbonatus]
MSDKSIPFSVIHSSSSEEGFDSTQLELSHQAHDTHQNIQLRGWETKKIPEYPQDLIIQLNPGLCHIVRLEILSHHYKIASQIDIYSGIFKDHQYDSTYIQFTRLGYVTLNNSTQFKDRELKSIKINADCEYIRFVIKGCHDNRVNVHKQVGILTLNIYGHIIMNDNESIHLANEPSMPVLLHDDQSMIDELANFDLEQCIRAIHKTEEEAAQGKQDGMIESRFLIPSNLLDEDYKEAKLYKELGERLNSLLEILINLEEDKMVAVAAKEYDEADKIKVDILQVKRSAMLTLKQSGIQITRDGYIVPFTPSMNLYDREETLIVGEGEVKPDQLLDEVMENWTRFDAMTIQEPIEEEEEEEEEEYTEEEEKSHSLPIEIKDPETIPEPLSEEERESCELSLSIFGEDIVACIMDMKVKCRQRGLNQLSQMIICYTELLQDQTSGEEVDVKFIQASFSMIQEAVTDSREIIFDQVIQAWKDLNDLCLISKVEENPTVLKGTERFLSALLTRSADSHPKIKAAANGVILTLVGVYSNPGQDMISFCFKERMIRNLKDAKDRIDLIRLIIQTHLLPKWKSAKTPVVYVDNVMSFILSYLKKHPHADARRSAWDLLVYVGQSLGTRPIVSYLDTETRKSLEAELKKISQREATSINSDTVKELRALAARRRSSAIATKKTRTTRAQTDQKKTKATNQRSQPSAKKETKNKTKLVKVEEIEEIEEEKSSVCIFCDEDNSNFNEDTLITHYYNHCPVLTNCPMCQIILEVSTLKEHYLEDCENRHLLKICSHCKTSIPVEQWLQHTLKKTCLATGENQTRCPFCLTDMTVSDESEWKYHLLNDCDKNPRRMME